MKVLNIKRRIGSPSPISRIRFESEVTVNAIYFSKGSEATVITAPMYFSGVGSNVPSDVQYPTANVSVFTEYFEGLPNDRFEGLSFVGQVFEVFLPANDCNITICYEPYRTGKRIEKFLFRKNLNLVR